ncbi:MAG: stage III sporulation protein AF [Clostridia bacterium]|nr:stage III sporulation protein AF [Clostridia bacterium]
MKGFDGMFTALDAYIKNIALLMLLAIFAEMLLPDAKIKKYVSVIVGIMLIFTVTGRLERLADSIENEDISLPAFEEKQAEKTENVRDRLTDILYEEMNEVENENEINGGLDIHVERVKAFEENTRGEVAQ